ncbi:MAG TPA: ornithine cyclodeaminase family protein [Geminicoccaceae bacterium]|nr:ornithine cyclodeaminase family protein [Geminicoccaceae bacterium]
MPLLDRAAVDAALPFPDLIEALRAGFALGCEAPVRHHHTVPRKHAPDATLLIMPAWQQSRRLGVKVVQISPGNDALGLPTVDGLYLLFEAHTGRPLAVMNGPAITERRTAAASALAASHLAREDARHHLVLGAGAVAAMLVPAHAAIRPIERVTLWNRTTARADKLAERLTTEGFDVAVTTDLDGALGEADIVSAATMSAVPLVKGALVRPGTHVDLVGAYNRALRESDDALMTRASLFVDTRGGALGEAGDIVQAIASGAIDEAAIQADLAELCRGDHPGRRTAEEVTVFKSVGAAIEDLVAAELVYERLERSRDPGSGR